MRTPGLAWALKDSLVAYVEALDDGVVEAAAPAARGGTGFAFPEYLPLADLVVGEPAAEADGSTSLEATASLTGHGRLLLGGQYEAGAALSPLLITVTSRHD